MENEAIAWNPWHGCHKCSPGCVNCFVYQMDKRYGRDTTIVTKVKTNFNLPIKRTRSGEYKYPSGTHFKLCFTSDFFIEEADEWRNECWDMIRQRKDCTFILTTKRASRIHMCLPKDWGDGWDNVTIAVSCENQEMADERVRFLMAMPAKHRYIFLSPILEYIDLNKLLAYGLIERVCVGGESYSGARLCDFTWVEQIYIDCMKNNTEFNFHQSGSNFLCDGTTFKGTLKDQWLRAEQKEEYLRNKYKNIDVSLIENVI